jgi:hypothetical protein
VTHNLIPDHLLRLAGKDVTSVFFQLHRADVLEKPAYKRLIIGTIEGQTAQFTPPKAGSLSLVPYAVSSQNVVLIPPFPDLRPQESAWLNPYFVSPYYNDVRVFS